MSFKTKSELFDILSQASELKEVKNNNFYKNMNKNFAEKLNIDHIFQGDLSKTDNYTKNKRKNELDKEKVLLKILKRSYKHTSRLVTAFLIFILVILFIHLFKDSKYLIDFKINPFSDSVLITLLTTTTVTVVSLYAIIIRGVFEVKEIDKNKK